ncbi:MAG: ADP-forming succinate--CoA ligase subunit beta [Candidatus Dasytiphilus stammeri]
MKLHEYQSKQILAKYGLPIPPGGYICSDSAELEKVVVIMGPPWVAKCQVHAGGRGKSGGVKIIQDKKNLRSFVKYWLGNRLVTSQTNKRGLPVNKILIEAVTPINQELYLSMLIDRSSCNIIFIASRAGGVNIEKRVGQDQNMIHKVIIDPRIGPQLFQGRTLAFKLGLYGELVSKFTKIFLGLSKLFIKYDLLLAEINPLAVTKTGDLICLDAKLRVDENALFRQTELCKMKDPSQEEPMEAYATECGLNYVSLQGNIGCMVNGAGLAMATMDIIKLYGGKPANFLDVGGGVTQNRVIEAFKIIINDAQVQAILVNIFGGIVSCDLIAEGIIRSMLEVNIQVPVIVRLEGNNADLGFKKLALFSLSTKNQKILVAQSLQEAAQLVVASTQNENKNHVHFN